MWAVSNLLNIRTRQRGTMTIELTAEICLDITREREREREMSVGRGVRPAAGYMTYENRITTKRVCVMYGDTPGIRTTTLTQRGQYTALSG